MRGWEAGGGRFAMLTATLSNQAQHQFQVRGQQFQPDFPAQRLQSCRQEVPLRPASIEL